MPHYISPPPMNPLSRVLAAVLAVLALVGAFFFGVFIFAIVAGLGLVVWVYLSIRLWWFRRRGGLNAAPGVAGGDKRQPPGNEEGQRDGKIIDGEYTVVSRRDEDS